MKKFLIILLFITPFFANAIEIEGEILTEYTSDNLDVNEEYNKGDKDIDSYLNLETTFKFKFNENVSLRTKWNTRPVNDRLYEDDYYAENSSRNVSPEDDVYGKSDYIERGFQYDSYGIIVEELAFVFENKELEFIAGKFNPEFGTAFKKSKIHGVYGVQMPEEYELTEKVGLSVAAIFPVLKITVSTFYDDTTDLSNSAINKRGKDKSNGGAGNTESLKSYTINFEGAVNNLRYNMGFRSLATELEQEEDEKGYVFGLEYLAASYTGNLKFAPAFEIARLENFNGNDSRNLTYLTTSLPIVYKGWSFVASNTLKRDSESEYKTYNGYLTQLSVGYKFESGLMVDIARKYEKRVIKAEEFTDNNNTYAELKRRETLELDSWAIMLSYLFEF